jgi:hypothetical protein
MKNEVMIINDNTNTIIPKLKEYATKNKIVGSQIIHRENASELILYDINVIRIVKEC